MTDVDALAEDLTDEDLKASPPCQCRSLWIWQVAKLRAFRRGEEHGFSCRRPSVARMRISCYGCGARYHLFLCWLHRGSFRRGLTVSCRACRRGGKCRGTDS
jgi:hypothetical protein